MTRRSSPGCQSATAAPTATATTTAAAAATTTTATTTTTIRIGGSGPGPGGQLERTCIAAAGLVERGADFRWEGFVDTRQFEKA